MSCFKKAVASRIRWGKAALLSASLALLSVYGATEAHADVRVARTLLLNQSISIYSYHCALSVKSKSPSGITTICSKAIRNRFKTRPDRKVYLGPKQVAKIKAKSCTLEVQREAAGKITIKCLPPATPIPQRQIGGTVSGLTGTVVLRNNGVNDLSVSSNGTFTFSSTATEGAQYNVTVFTQPAGQTCSVSNGSGAVGSANVTNIGLACTTNTTTLSSSVSNLALSVTGLTEYGVSGTPSSGVPRVITVTNTGTAPAVNLFFSPPTWPSGTTSFTSCGSTLAAGSSCTITIVPGNTATSDGTNPCTTGTAPIANSITITADNATSVSTNIVVLGYGCIYQGGYVFALDDTTPNTGSVGGKVLSTTDQAPVQPNGVVWGSNGGIGGGVGGISTVDCSQDEIPGISETSTSTSSNPTFSSFASLFSSFYTNPNPFSSSDFASCDGAIDGACNTTNIVTFYDEFVTNNTLLIGGSSPYTATPGPTNRAFYAAGLCRQTINSYNDWYLPAICELGYNLSVCGAPGPDTLQNVQRNLVDFNSLSLVAGSYWSSTEESSYPLGTALVQAFTSYGAPRQDAAGKENLLGVRCVRQLTY